MIDYPTAKKYLDFGWSVFPVNITKVNGKFEKRPAVAWQDYQGRLPTDIELHSWFDTPIYNAIGLATGKISGIAVVDVDDPKDWTGFYSPLVAKTISGGSHYYFKWTGEIRNATRIGDRAIDIRGDGGFVVLPPSGCDGLFYEWVRKSNNLTPLPEEIKKLLPSGEKFFEKFNIAEALNVPLGQRNDKMKSLMASLLNKHSVKEAWELVVAANNTYSPPLPLKELEVKFNAVKKFVEENPLDEEPSSSLLFEVSSEDIVQSEDSGIEAIDEVIRGFRYGNTYLVGGIEKAGKSSLLMQIATYLMKKGRAVSFLNTELTDQEFRVAMSAIDTNKPKTEIEKDLESQKNWTRKYKEKLFYSGIKDLTNPKSDTPDFERLMIRAKHFIDKGARIFFFDNLSTFANQSSSKTNWEVLSSCGSRVINFAKRTGSLCLVVIHAKNDVVFSETPAGIRKYIEDNEPEKVFSESISVVRRLTGNDIHGGSIFRSQLSGTILIWRPFQNFEKSEMLPKQTGIILESFRHAKSGSLIRMEFDGAKGQFVEDELAGVMENLK